MFWAKLYFIEKVRNMQIFFFLLYKTLIVRKFSHRLILVWAKGFWEFICIELLIKYFNKSPFILFGSIFIMKRFHNFFILTLHNFLLKLEYLMSKIWFLFETGSFLFKFRPEFEKFFVLMKCYINHFAFFNIHFSQTSSLTFLMKWFFSSIILQTEFLLLISRVQ